MILVSAVLCSMLALAGLVVALAAAFGVIPRAPRHARRPLRRFSSVLERIARIPRRTLLSVLLGVALGLVLMYATGWPLLVLLVPAALVGVPRLLSDPPQDNIRLLEALDRWVRGMLAQMSTGRSITDALRASARQSPTGLGDPLALLVRRLDDRWTTPQALQAMADELASADADAVLAALVLSAQRGGTGASVTLYALAEAIQERLRALREIEAERAKPRVVVRQVSFISGITLAAFVLLSPGFFAPYGTPLGQVILAILLALYVLAVWTMRRMTLARSRERILRSLT